MKKVMRKFWIITLLTIIGQVASAQIVDLNDSYTGGTIRVTDYSEPADDGSVVVTITVEPYTGYYIAKSDILVTLTYGGGYSTTRRDGAPGIGDYIPLTYAEGEDVVDLTAPRDYTFTVPENLGAWVEVATFHSALNISGDADSEVVWSYDVESGTISISGNGSTFDFEGDGFTDPWASIRANVTSVLIEKGVTYLGTNIFAGCTSLSIITIEDNEKLLTLGENAIPTGVDVNVPGNLFNEYMITDGWKDLSVISKDAVEMTGVKFGTGNQYDVFADLDQALMVPSVASIYTVSAVDEHSLVLSQLEAIPAGVPVLVFCDNANLKNKPIYSAKTSAEASRATNLLNVVKEDKGLSVGLGEVYLMYNDVFYYSQACTIPKGGVYLSIPEDTPVVKARASYALGSRNDTTGIINLTELLSEGEGAWYGLDGRKYDSMPTTKGIYIHNGKKIVIK
jgi:hypothetical protein